MLATVARTPYQSRSEPTLGVYGKQEVTANACPNRPNHFKTRAMAQHSNDLRDYLKQDDFGYFHMSLVDGKSIAFAPSIDQQNPPAGKALVAAADGPVLMRLSETLKLSGHNVFLMNIEDFDEFAEMILAGKIKPVLPN